MPTTVTNQKFVVSATNKGTSLSASITFPAGLKKDDLLVLYVANTVLVTAGSQTTPTDWFSVENATDTTATIGGRLGVYYRYHDAAATSATIAIGGVTDNDWVVHLVAYRYAGFPTTAANPFIAESSLAESSALGDTTITTNNASTIEASVADGKAWVASSCLVISTSGTTITSAPSGWTSTQRQQDLQASTRLASFDSNAGTTDGDKNTTYTSASSAGKVAWIGTIHACEAVEADFNTGLVDTKAFKRTSVRTDNEPLTDPFTRTTRRTLIDNEPLTDAFTRSVLRTLTDPEALSDTRVFHRTLGPMDPEGLTDPKGLFRTSVRTDNESLTDPPRKTQNKGSVNLEALTDTKALRRTTGRTDLEGLTDTKAFRQTKPRTDNAGSSDRREISRGKQITDSTGLNDVDFFAPYSKLRILGTGSSSSVTYKLTFVEGVGMTESTAGTPPRDSYAGAQVAEVDGSY